MNSTMVNISISAMTAPSSVSFSGFIFAYAVNLPLVLFGVFGNILTLIMLTRSKVPTSESTKLKFIHLTIADLLSLLFTGLMILLHANSYFDPKGAAQAKIVTIPYTGYSLSHIPSGMSSLILMYLALERAVAVASPFKVRTVCSSSVVKIILTVSYIVVGIVCVIKASEYTIVTKPSGYATKLTRLGEYIGFFEFIDLFIVFAFYCIPICVTFMCNLIMSYSLFKSAKAVRMRVTDVNDTRRQKDRKITLMVFVVTLMSIICVTPHVATRTLIAFGRRDNFLVKNGVVVSLFLKGVNHSMNFVLYIVTVSEYRKAFVRLFKKENRTVDSITLTQRLQPSK